MTSGPAAATAALLTLASLGSPAWANSTSAPKLGKPPQAIQIKNRAHHPIAYAAATVSGSSKQYVFTNGHPPLQESVGQMAYVPAGSCITSVFVRFTNGRTMSLDHQHDCHSPTIQVEPQGILLTSGAVTNPPPLYEKRGEMIPPGGALPPAAPPK
jgi:hypothetical protein